MSALRRSALVDGLRLAFGTLTALPVRPPVRIDGAVAGVAMTLAVLPGLVLGVLGALVVWLAQLAALAPLVAATVAVATVTAASRAIHLDGLADTADGLAATAAGRGSVEAVMRRGDVGPIGLVTVVLVLIAQVGALGALVAGGVGPLAVVVIVGPSRAFLALACVAGVPAARPDGLGAVVAGSVPRWRAVLVGAVVLAAAGSVAPALDQPAWQPVVAVAAGAAAATAVTVRCVRRLGGVTGDVLGATVETAAAVSAIVLAVGAAT